MQFKDLNIIEPICKALEKEGYLHPCPIQEKSIPFSLEGKDILGLAQTGTGKTAAYLVPILQKLASNSHSYNHKKISALILVPTRELATQVSESLKVYGEFTKQKYVVIFGGVSQRNQEMALRGKIDILISTPGRLLDLINQKIISLQNVETLVLDEADKMLNMGFITDVRKIVSKVPKKRQTLFFSATFPNEIMNLAKEILTNPVRVEVEKTSTANENIEQEILMIHKKSRIQYLFSILEKPEFKKVIVFTKMKHTANRLQGELERNGFKSAAIHGNKSQNNRANSIAKFKNSEIQALVATDIASRGIDIDGVTHVINYELPLEAESYIHRIGRTGRAGSKGKAISFCDLEDRKMISEIEKLMKKKIPVQNISNIDLTFIPKANEKEEKVFQKNNPNKSKPKSKNAATNSYFSRKRKSKK
jgi:ATP-dependent RNA helicase RhlE